VGVLAERFAELLVADVGLGGTRDRLDLRVVVAPLRTTSVTDDPAEPNASPSAADETGRGGRSAR
jgi:hypothetical protein